MKRKAYVALLTLLTTATLTACSFQFAPLDNTASSVSSIKDEVFEKIGSIVDNTDFKDLEDLSEMSSKLTEWAQDLTEENEELGEFQKATLVRVVDGDTIVVEVDYEEFKVRLIGVNTPESVASKEYLEYKGTTNSEEGKAASEFVKNMLANTKYVYLRTDTSDEDRYGRKLRYVWLEIPENERSIEEIRTKMLNGILLDEGVAEVALYKPDLGYADEFQAIYTHTTDVFENDK